jgi:hypothetical protein
MWDMEQDACSVARARIASCGATMGKPAQDLDSLEDHVVCRRATQVGDETKTTRVALERRVVHATLGGQRHSDLEYTEVDATRQLERWLDWTD